MISLARQWKNGILFYGNTSNLRYDILTYTWGRWKLDCGLALGIDGVSWRIPPVNPDQLSVENLKRVLHKISATTDYIWIDVVCIDDMSGLG
jgi:hypothetical protein